MVLIILLIACILVIVDYINFRTIRLENIYENDFNYELYKTVENYESFKMKDVTPFIWDKIYIIRPYISKLEMEKILGEKWTTSDTYLEYLIEKTFLGKHPLDDDSLHKLIFTKEGKVILDITINRMEIDFTRLNDYVYPNDIEFFIQEESNRKIVLNNNNYIR